MGSQDGYRPNEDAIVGGILRPSGEAGQWTLHAALLSDQLFMAIWPTMFSKIERGYKIEAAPPEDIAAAATMATWAAVYDILEDRMNRHDEAPKPGAIRVIRPAA